MFISVKLVIS